MQEEVRSKWRIITHNTYTTAGVFFVVIVYCDLFFLLYCVVLPVSRSAFTLRSSRIGS